MNIKYIKLMLPNLLFSTLTCWATAMWILTMSEGISTDLVVFQLVYGMAYILLSGFAYGIMVKNPYTPISDFRLDHVPIARLWEVLQVLVFFVLVILLLMLDEHVTKAMVMPSVLIFTVSALNELVRNMLYKG